MNLVSLEYLLTNKIQKQRKLKQYFLLWLGAAYLIFFRNTLTVMFHNGMSNNDKDYEMCMRVEGAVLPKNGFFGISAATGGLADDHDVLKFNVFSLRSPEQVKFI